MWSEGGARGRFAQLTSSLASQSRKASADPGGGRGPGRMVPTTARLRATAVASSRKGETTALARRT